MLASPLPGVFWCEPSSTDTVVNNGNEVTEDIVDDHSCRSYRADFVQSEHYDFCGVDSVVGPLVLSVKYYSNHCRVILRLVTGTRHRIIQHSEEVSPLQLAQTLCPQITIKTLQPVIYPTATTNILSYDE